MTRWRRYYRSIVLQVRVKLTFTWEPSLYSRVLLNAGIVMIFLCGVLLRWSTVNQSRPLRCFHAVLKRKKHRGFHDHMSRRRSRCRHTSLMEGCLSSLDALHPLPLAVWLIGILLQEIIIIIIKLRHFCS